MHGFKHRTQRLKRGYTAIQARARQGDYEARLKNNIFEARVIAFETSPHRLIPRHSYKNALFATRRLISNTFLLRKNASTNAHHAVLNKTEALLLAARDHAMVKSFDVSVAQDVFVLLSHYLGLTAVPEEPPQYHLHTSSFARHKSFVAEKVQDHARNFARRRSAQPAFTRKSNSLASLDLEHKPNPRLPRACASFSDLGAEHVEEQPYFPM